MFSFEIAALLFSYNPSILVSNQDNLDLNSIKIGSGKHSGRGVFLMKYRRYGDRPKCLVCQQDWEMGSNGNTHTQKKTLQ